MDIFKIIGVGLIGGILSMTVKQYKKEYALLVALATVTVILFFTLDTLETAISQISLITEKSGVDTRYFTAVMKVVGVASVSYTHLKINVAVSMFGRETPVEIDYTQVEHME